MHVAKLCQPPFKVLTIIQRLSHVGGNNPDCLGIKKIKKKGTLLHPNRDLTLKLILIDVDIDRQNIALYSVRPT